MRRESRLILTRLTRPKQTRPDPNQPGATVAAEGSTPATTRIGTVDVLRFVLERYEQESEFSLVLGTDSYNDLLAGKWRQSDVLLKLLHKLYVVARPGIKEGVAKGGPGIVEAPALLPISSTKVRQALAWGWADFRSERLLEEALHPAVLTYIRKEGLYHSQRSWLIGAGAALVVVVAGVVAALYLRREDERDLVE